MTMVEEVLKVHLTQRPTMSPTDVINFTLPLCALEIWKHSLGPRELRVSAKDEE